MSRACRATSLFSLPRGYLISRPAVCCRIQCRPFVRVSCRSRNSPSPTRTTCRVQIANILVRHARFPRDLLATSSRGCREETASVVESKLKNEQSSLLTLRARRVCTAPGALCTPCVRSQSPAAAADVLGVNASRPAARSAVNNGSATFVRLHTSIDSPRLSLSLSVSVSVSVSQCLGPHTAPTTSRPPGRMSGRPAGHRGRRHQRVGRTEGRMDGRTDGRRTAGEER